MEGLISIISALALLLAGAWLLHDGVSGRHLLQIEIIAGATLLSVGVVCSVLLLRHWMKWRRELGKYRRIGRHFHLDRAMRFNSSVDHFLRNADEVADGVTRDAKATEVSSCRSAKVPRVNA